VLKQDEDVLDTWASSWLWPISVFDGFAKPDGDIKYYYPTSDLITAPEILFFWVARMIIAGYEYKKEKPFTNVYLTGIVRDKQGRKMSKSLGNSPEPLELISKYSADGVRVGMLLCSPAGNDLLFDESYCEQGRNFANKVWNAFRLINGWSVKDLIPNPSPEGEGDTPERNQVAIDWFAAKLSSEIENINDLYSKYRISEALMLIRDVERRYGSAPNPWVAGMMEHLQLVGGTWLAAEIAGKLVGCELALQDNGAQVVTALGLADDAPHAYFALGYEDIRLAIETGAGALYWGSGAYDVKERLGFSLYPNNLVAFAGLGPAPRMIARVASALI
jgi:hypothetical protein